MRRFLVIAAASLATCSCGMPSQPETVVAVAVASPAEMPFHGHWTGTTTVEVLRAGGRAETLTATFTFR